MSKETVSTEKAAIQAMIRWAKSDETKVTDEIQTAIDAYCSVHWANVGRCNEEVVENRKTFIDSLICGCVPVLHSEQLAKFDSVKDQLARHFSPEQIKPTGQRIVLPEEQLIMLKEGLKTDLERYERYVESERQNLQYLMEHKKDDTAEIETVRETLRKGERWLKYFCSVYSRFK